MLFEQIWFEKKKSFGKNERKEMSQSTELAYSSGILQARSTFITDDQRQIGKNFVMFLNICYSLYIQHRRQFRILMGYFILKLLHSRQPQIGFQTFILRNLSLQMINALDEKQWQIMTNREPLSNQIYFEVTVKYLSCFLLGSQQY